MNKADIALSKRLSWLLRHGAREVGLIMQEDGFLNVDDILALKQFNRYTVEDIERVVKNNDKQRFLMEQIPNMNGKWRIRANQGHSIPVSEELVMTPLVSEESLPSVAIHGTTTTAWDVIKNEGLSRMSRQHIHLVDDIPRTDKTLRSGIKKNSKIIIYIDIHRAFKDGIKFYRSVNNVILTPGNENGFLSNKYFKEVWRIYPERCRIL